MRRRAIFASVWAVVRRACHFGRGSVSACPTGTHRAATGQSRIFSTACGGAACKEFFLGMDASMATSTSPPPAAKQSPPIARNRARLAGLRDGLLASRPRRYAVFALMAVVVAGVLYGGTLAMFHTQMFLLRRTRPTERPTLAMALDALGHDSYLEARRLAESLDRQTLDPADQGGPDYVLGVVAAHEAGELWGPERKNYFLLAARYLKLARERGFNQATGPTGTVLLGQSLYYAGRVKASRPVLEQAIELAPDEATMIHRLLADAYRRKPKRNLEQALAHNRKYLEDADLSPTDRQAGQLQQANLLWQMKDYAACQKVIEEIPADAFLRAEVDLLRGRLAMHEARNLKKQLGAEATEAEREQVQQHYQEAIKILRQAQDDPLGEVAIRQSMYLIGLCLMEMGDSTAALAQFQRTHKVYLDTPEGLAAGLEEADLLRALHRDDDALAEYRQVLGGIREKPAFSNRWIGAKKFRARILKAYQYYLEVSTTSRPCNWPSTCRRCSRDRKASK